MMRGSGTDPVQLAGVADVRQTRVRLLALAPVAVGGAYLIWRGGWTLNLDTLWLALPLLLAEVHGYFVYLLSLLMTWDVTPPESHPAPEGRDVDLYITTFDEPAWVLAPTVAGTVAVRYPHRTYVLDDGRRLWVRELATELGAEYLTRPDNRGAKAGNINDALPRTGGEFIGILDADFVPATTFVDDLLGYFDEPDLAIVQGPQEFYNADSFQHRGGRDEDWHDQSLFYRVIQPGKNRWNATFWAGTRSLVRRRTLEDCGGVVEDSVTEDLHTSLRLHQRGWRTLFHPQTVARGIAPENYDAFIIQRVRWARGAMQVIRQEWFRRGLTLAQRASYIASTTTYFDSFRKLVLLATIPLILITDRLPISGDAEVFLTVWLIQALITTIGTKAIGRGNYRVLDTEVFDLMKLFAFARASLTIVHGGVHGFRVTPKGHAASKSWHPFLVPVGLLGLLYVGALWIDLARLAGLGLEAANPAATAAVVVWGSAVLSALVFVSWQVYRHFTKRRAYRLDVRIKATLRHDQSAAWATVRDLTMLGAAVDSAVAIEPGAAVRLELDGMARGIEATVRARTGRAGQWQLRLEFASTVVHGELARLVAEHASGARERSASARTEASRVAA